MLPEHVELALEGVEGVVVEESVVLELSLEMLELCSVCMP